MACNRITEEESTASVEKPFLLSVAFQKWCSGAVQNCAEIIALLADNDTVKSIGQLFVLMPSSSCYSCPYSSCSFQIKRSVSVWVLLPVHVPHSLPMCVRCLSLQGARRAGASPPRVRRRRMGQPGGSHAHDDGQVTDHKEGK